MKKLFGLLLFSTVVLAQSVPNGTIVQGQIWTPAQWNTAWQSKADTSSPVFSGSASFGEIALPLSSLNMTGTYGATTSLLYMPGLFIFGTPSTPPNGFISPFNIYISGDTVDAVTNGNGFLTGFSVLDAPGAGFKGGRSAIQGAVSVVGSPSVITTAGIVGVLGLTRASANMLGTTGAYVNYSGSVFGGNSNVFTTTGATFLTTVDAHEFDSTLSTGTSAADHYGISIVKGAAHAVRGAFDDSAISINDQDGPTVGWGYGVSFGSYAHHWAFSATSTLIGAQLRQSGGTETDIALNGVDFRNVSFQSGGVAFASTGFSVDPSGALVASAISIGSSPVSTATAANPTGTVGLTAVNGAASTYPRSDSSPALSQAIAPIWSGTHVFSGVVSAATATTAVSVGNEGAGVPSIRWISSTAGTDSKEWRNLANTTDLLFQTRNDTNSTGSTWLDVARSGSAIGSVAFGNAIDNPGYFFNGTGAISGVGSGLTALNGTNISSGTVASARLPASSVTLAGTSGSIGGGALIAGQCASGTATVTSATTSMVALADPNTYPGDGTVWDAQVTSANTVTVKVCAIIALTPTSSTYNVRVLQ